MNDETLKLNQIECDKCCGSGAVYDIGVYELLSRWRQGLNVSKKHLSAMLKIPYTSYCKFEVGRIVFSEQRIRQIVRTLQILSEAKELCCCAVRIHGASICRHCKKPYSADGHVFQGR